MPFLEHVGEKSTCIAVMKNALSKHTCDAFIEFCQRDYYRKFSPGPVSGGLNTYLKSSMDFSFHAEFHTDKTSWLTACSFFQELQSALWMTVNAYIEKYDRLWATTDLYDSGFRVQHYPKNHGFFRPHHDGDPWTRNEGKTNTRVLGIVMYLNTIESGGQTAFPLHEVSVSAEAGSIAVFPASWTHPHQGLLSLKQDKWIVSTFIQAGEVHYDN